MTISSEVGIYNLALNAVGDRSNISSPTENSRQAEVCRLWYEPVLEQILAAAPWPEATRIEYLALLATQDDDTWANTEPAPGFGYLYALPADCIHPRYLTDFSKFRITYFGDNQRVLHSNTENAALAYTADIENVSLFGPQLRMAIVYGLAAHICMPLNGKPSRAEKLLRQANDLLWNARETAANMSNEQFDFVPDWIAARGGAYSTYETYAYPLGSLLSLPSAAV